MHKTLDLKHFEFYFHIIINKTMGMRITHTQAQNLEFKF